MQPGSIRATGGNGPKLTKEKLIALAAVSLVIPAALFAEPGEKKDMTGVWEVSISPTGVPPPPIRALSMFLKDGSFVATLNRSVPPAPPIQAVAAEMGPAYGQWVQTGDREFQLTFYAAMWNKEGARRGRNCRLVLSLSKTRLVGALVSAGCNHGGDRIRACPSRCVTRPPRAMT